MAAKKILTMGEAIVIGIIAKAQKKSAAEFDAETIVDGYRFPKIVKERVGCKTMMIAPQLRIQDIAGAISDEDVVRYTEKVRMEKEVVRK